MPRSMPRAFIVSLGLLVLASLASEGSVGASEPGAFDTLARIGGTYQRAESFRSTGTLEVEAPGEPVRRFRLRVLRGPENGFRLDLERAAGPDGTFPWKVLWRSPERAADGSPGGRVFHWDADRGQVKEATSLGAEVEDDLLAVWPRVPGLEVLPVVALVLFPDHLDETPVAAFDGEEPCGAGDDEPCRLLVLSRRGGTVETLLAVDREHRIRRSEVTVHGPRGPAGRTDGAIVFRWRSETGPATAGEEEIAFVPPAGTLWGARWQEGGTPFGRPDFAAEAPLATFGGSIDVGLLSLAVRVLDAADRPVRDLAPEDFRVTVRLEGGGRMEGGGRRGDRRSVPVVHVEWVGHGGGGVAPTARDPGDREAEPPESPRLPGDGAWDEPLRQPWKRPGSDPGEGTGPGGRRLVLLVQSDVHAVRTRGHLKFLPWVEELLAGLPPAEPVAVLGFDSHLKLFQDFTLDRPRIQEAVWEAVHFGARSPRPRGRDGGPLARVLDFAAARDAATPEQALGEIARALGRLPGSEEVIWIGWGLGTYHRGAVSLGPGWGDLHDDLAAADVRVSVLDVTDAGSHTLELGLRRVAAATGGTYAKTAEFPGRAVRALVEVLGGHWVLHLDVGELDGEVAGVLEVRLAERPGRVLLGPATGGAGR